MKILLYYFSLLSLGIISGRLARDWNIEYWQQLILILIGLLAGIMIGNHKWFFTKENEKE